MSIMGAPPLLGRPPVVLRKPHASRGRNPRGVKGFWTGIARPEGTPTRTGTFTPVALPTVPSAVTESKPGHLGGGNHSAPGGCSYPPVPQSQALPPRAGRPTCAGRQRRGRGAAARATEPRRWLERRLAPALQGAAPSAGLRRALGGVGGLCRRVRVVRKRQVPVSALASISAHARLWPTCESGGDCSLSQLLQLQFS